jgi:membrane protease YdiL (CAAX protease family)
VRTAIGQHLRSSPAALATALAVAAAVIAADFALVCSGDYLLCVEGRGALAVLALAAQVRLVTGDLASVGLRLTPVQGWWYWGRAALLIGLGVLACVVVGFGAWVLAGWELPKYATPPAAAGAAFLRMCLFVPVQEEAVYRLALCVPLAVWLGPWGAVAVSGLVFGGLHWAYGNPSPENQVAGFLLAWAYLKSESIAAPVILHGLGNLCALAAQVGTWYWLRGPA